MGCSWVTPSLEVLKALVSLILLLSLPLEDGFETKWSIRFLPSQTILRF